MSWWTVISFFLLGAMLGFFACAFMAAREIDSLKAELFNLHLERTRLRGECNALRVEVGRAVHDYHS